MDKDTKDPSPKDDYEYNVKWQGKAHYHATWETHAYLNTCRGWKRLDNYIKKYVQQDIYMAQDDDVAPEDKENWNLDRERDIDRLNDYIKVERVLDMVEDDNGDISYYVKCKYPVRSH